MSATFSPRGQPPGYGGALVLKCVAVCRPPVWHNNDRQMIRGFRGESEVQVPIPAPHWLLSNQQYWKLRGAFQFTALDNFDVNMQIEAYDTSRIPANWNNLWLHITAICHPSQLTWNNVQFLQGASDNPIVVGESAGEPTTDDYEAPVLLVRDGLYAPVVVESGYRDDVEIDVQALPPAIIPKIPTVSFDGIVEGSAETLLKRGTLRYDLAKCSGFVRLSTFLDPGQQQTNFARGNHGFSIFVLVPITESPYKDRWGWLGKRKRSIFEPHSRFVCTLGKVVGILCKENMLRPPQGQHDRVLIVVPEEWLPHPELIGTAESLASVTTGVNLPAHRARSQFRKSAGTSTQASGSGSSSSPNSQSDPRLSVTHSRSVDSLPSSQDNPMSSSPLDGFAVSPATQPSMDTDLSMDTELCVDTDPSLNTHPPTDADLSMDTQTRRAADTAVEVQPLTDTQSSMDSQMFMGSQASMNTQASTHSFDATPAALIRTGSNSAAEPADLERSFDSVVTTRTADGLGNEADTTGAGVQSSSQPTPRTSESARGKTRKRVGDAFPQGRKRRKKAIEVFNELGEKRRRPVAPRDPGPVAPNTMPNG